MQEQFQAIAALAPVLGALYLVWQFLRDRGREPDVRRRLDAEATKAEADSLSATMELFDRILTDRLNSTGTWMRSELRDLRRRLGAIEQKLGIRELEDEEGKEP